LTVEINSLKNQKVRDIVKLRQKRHRDKTGKTIIDGVKALNSAFRNGYKVDAVYYDIARKITGFNDSVSKKTFLQPVSHNVFKKIGYGDNPDGYLGIASQKSMRLEDIPLNSRAFYLIVQSIEKPGNLGAVLRSADAAGVTGVIICDAVTDVWNPNVIRASRGAVFSVPTALCDSKTVINWARRKNIKIYAASPDGGAVYWKVSFTFPSAAVIGSEHSGLSREWKQFENVTIPMKGQIDSLNAAQTATLLMFEVLKQREE